MAKYIQVKIEIPHVQQIWHGFRTVLTNRTPVRTTTSVLVSLGLHLFLFQVYQTASSRQVEVAELQEISFVDLTQEGNKAQSRPTEKSIATPKPAKKSEQVVQVKDRTIRPPVRKKQPDRKPPVPRQAPINLASLAPISLAATKPDGRLKISQSHGSDLSHARIQTAAAINLDRSDNAPIPGVSHPKSFIRERTTRPGIELSLNTVAPSKLQRSGALTSPVSSRPEPRDVKLLSNKSRVVITGQLSQRAIMHKNMPSFPAAARRAGVGATISIRFSVMADGQVKENLVVIHTSGSRDWDNQVISALSTWLFEPLSSGAGHQDQSGIITFHFVID